MPQFNELPNDPTPDLADLVALQAAAGGPGSSYHSTIAQLLSFAVLVSGLTADWDAGDFRITADSFAADGIILVGGAAAPTGTAAKVVAFGDNAGDPTPAADTAVLYAKDVAGAVTLYAIREGGTAFEVAPQDLRAAGTPQFAGLGIGIAGSAGNLFLSGSYNLAWGSDYSAWIVGNTTEDYLFLGTANAERVRIDADGNILVGTAISPTGTATKVAVFGDNAGDPTPRATRPVSTPQT